MRQDSFSFLSSPLHPKVHITQSSGEKWHHEQTYNYGDIYSLSRLLLSFIIKSPLKRNSETYLTYYEMSQLNTFLRHSY